MLFYCRKVGNLLTLALRKDVIEMLFENIPSLILALSLIFLNIIGNGGDNL